MKKFFSDLCGAVLQTVDLFTDITLPEAWRRNIPPEIPHPVSAAAVMLPGIAVGLVVLIVCTLASFLLPRGGSALFYAVVVSFVLYRRDSGRGMAALASFAGGFFNSEVRGYRAAAEDSGVMQRPFGATFCGILFLVRFVALAVIAYAGFFWVVIPLLAVDTLIQYALYFKEQDNILPAVVANGAVLAVFAACFALPAALCGTLAEILLFSVLLRRDPYSANEITLAGESASWVVLTAVLFFCF